MNKKLISLIPALFLIMMVLSSCGKKKPDTSKYAEVCSKVARCDKQFQVIPDAQKHCQNIMAKLEEKAPASTPGLMECLDKSSCEETNFQQCATKHLQDLKGLMP
jgi:hypothetical protein